MIYKTTQPKVKYANVQLIDNIKYIKITTVAYWVASDCNLHSYKFDPQSKERIMKFSFPGQMKRGVEFRQTNNGKWRTKHATNATQKMSSSKKKWNMTSYHFNEFPICSDQLYLRNEIKNFFNIPYKMKLFILIVRRSMKYVWNYTIIIILRYYFKLLYNIIFVIYVLFHGFWLLLLPF